MEKYTEDQHAENLLKMLELDNPCNHCPIPSGVSYICWFCCPICQRFINLPNLPADAPKCPCYRLGPREAIKRTWIALEEKGYI